MLSSPLYPAVVTTPVTLRCLRKIRVIAIRNFQVFSKSGIFFEILVNDLKVVARKNASWGEYGNSTFFFSDGELQNSESSFKLRIVNSDGECLFTSNLSLLANSIDLGPGLDSITLPSEPRIYIKLSNGIWTTSGGAFNSTIPVFSAVNHQLEPRLLPYSRMLEGARVVSRLLAQKSAVEIEYKSIRDEIITRFELKDKKERWRIQQLKKAIDKKLASLTSLEEKLKASEGRVFHKRNGLREKWDLMDPKHHKTIVGVFDKLPCEEQLGVLKDQTKSIVAIKIKKIHDIFPILLTTRPPTIRDAPFVKNIFENREEETVATALSYVVLVLTTLLRLHDACVKNTLVFCGSRSALLDYSSGKLLPLYYAGVERADYIKAVELLHDMLLELAHVIRKPFQNRGNDLLADLYTILNCKEK